MGVFQYGLNTIMRVSTRCDASLPSCAEWSSILPIRSNQYGDIMAKTKYPIVEKGSHLTVTTYEDGRTELVWDHDALLKDVQDAINSHETVELVGSLALGQKPKRTRKTKGE